MAPHMLTVIALASLASAYIAPHQKILGPAFPAPSNVGSASPIRCAVKSVTKALDRVIANGQNPFLNFTGNSTSVSVTAIKAGEDVPFLDYHFTSSQLNSSAGSTSKVSSDSVYRIGSVSKLFTVYALLLNNGMDHWNTPVTEFIPELKQAAAKFPPGSSAIEHVLWEEVTVEALASQLSGLGRDYNSADLASQDFPFREAGLPELPPEDIPTCAGDNSQPPCDRKTFLQGFAKRHPVYAPFTSATYSNSAFVILGYVIESITGLTYGEVIQKDIVEPLGLEGTSVTRPDTGGVGVIPSGDSGWFRDAGDGAPTGGLYSTSRDLAIFGNAILSSKQLSPSDTRRWMKPAAHTSTLTFSVGAPWEIWRTQSQIASGHAIDLYTKSGSDGEYDSFLFLVPDLDVTFAVLAAGLDSGEVVKVVAEMVLQAFLPVLDDVSRAQACKRFCGKYALQDGDTNSSLILSVDEHGPGLVVDQWISNGSDLRAIAQAYADATNGGTITSARLYPSNLHFEGSSSASGAESKVSYRTMFETVPLGFDPSVTRIMATTAGSWSMVDQLMYGGIAVDEFVFTLDGEGSVVTVEPRALRAVFERVDG